MTRKYVLLVIAFVLSLSAQVKADEGMWLLALLKQMNITQMQAKGFKLTAEDIYNLNQPSLKDAVVGLGSEGRDFGFSCTAELISPEGLMLTNHHCGYDEIQSHSSVDHNYVDRGFWAFTKADELPNPGKTASFFVRMEDVTEQVLKNVTAKMTEAERDAKISEVIQEISEKAVEGTHYKATVKDFFAGNNYYLLVYETFLDVRLVGAPPSSIGKFGGDTDNWMWPRHTGDFSIFRVYCGEDGKPAPYSEKNVPLKSKRFFPISLKGIQEGDFAMIMGYPGSTERYTTSWGVKQTMDEVNKARIEVRTKKLAILKEDMNADKEVYIKYTSKYAGSSNYWKYSIGQNKGLKNLNVVSKKEKIETDLRDWMKQDATRVEKYGNALSLIENSIQSSAEVTHVQQYLYEALLDGPEFVMFAYNIFPYYQAMRYGTDLEEATTALLEATKAHFKDYNAPTDKKLTSAMFEIFAANVDAANRPQIFGYIDETMGADYTKYADQLFASSIFTSQQRMLDFIDAPNMQPLLDASAFLGFVQNIGFLKTVLLLSDENEEIKQQAINEVKKASIDFFADRDMEKEALALKEALNEVIKNVEQAKRPAIFKVIETQYGGSIDKFVDAMMKKSILANEKKLEKFLKKPKYDKIEDDLALQTVESIIPMLKLSIIENDLAFKTTLDIIRTYFDLQAKSKAEDLQRGSREFLAALMEMQKDRKFYPDANSTMRLTYGTVGGYKAADALRYKHFTTLSGVMEKEDPENDEFIVEQKLKELYEKKDFGVYGENGVMKVCFLTNTDITGGNSGSPVINGNGELIGCAFDGNWEAMSGDIAFEPELQRTICVDIRYVLFIIDKFAGATNLIEEMKIVK